MDLICAMNASNAGAVKETAWNRNPVPYTCFKDCKNNNFIYPLNCLHHLKCWFLALSSQVNLTTYYIMAVYFR